MRVCRDPRALDRASGRRSGTLISCHGWFDIQELCSSKSQWAAFLLWLWSRSLADCRFWIIFLPDFPHPVFRLVPVRFHEAHSTLRKTAIRYLTQSWPRLPKSWSRLFWYRIGLFLDYQSSESDRVAILRFFIRGKLNWATNKNLVPNLQRVIRR